MSKALKKELKEQAVKTLSENYGIGEESTLFMSTQYIGNVGTCLVRVYVVNDGRIYNITGLVANATEVSTHDRDGKSWIKTTGYGYSRAQHVADGLSWVMFGRGDALAYEEI